MRNFRLETALFDPGEPVAAIALHPESHPGKLEDRAYIRYAVVAGPSEKPSIMDCGLMKPGNAFKLFSHSATYFQDEIRDLCNSFQISGLVLQQVDNWGGYGAVKVTKKLANRMRTEGVILSLFPAFPFSMVVRLTDAIRRLGETKWEGLCDKGEDYRGIEGWAKLPGPDRQNVACALALVQTMESSRVSS